ncbi:MAG: glycosyltransferase [Polyangiaceae bacterium]|nr:glycosyltransferase [Polyangiaceae bacterium]
MTLHIDPSPAPRAERALVGLRRPAAAAELEWPRRVGILNDYVRVPYANGSSFASQFLYRELSVRGHEVTIIGPHDPDATEAELPRRHVVLPSFPLRNHPGVHVPMPSRASFARVAAAQLDVVLAQCTTSMLDLGLWLRLRHRVPFVCVNTLHLPSVYNVLLPDSLNENRAVNSFFSGAMMPWVERQMAANYNRSDGLVVLSEKLERYWRERGVTVPIHVIPRSVEPKVFDAPIGADPFPAEARRGARLLVVCRHSREKGIARLLEIFARWIAPEVPEATLTLVGDGPDHDAFRARAAELGIADRAFFVGEKRLLELPTWYRHADLFVYTSLSETYGQVVSEAAWCGLPIVALEDGMGVSQQVRDGETGVLVRPGPDTASSDWKFGTAAVALLRNGHRRRALAHRAQEHARLRADPRRCVQRYYDAFTDAKRHCEESTRTPASRLLPAGLVGRWVGLHSLLLGLGTLREPAVLNRHGARPPTWEELLREDDPVLANAH